ncbi:MAG: hypothetical protein EON60_09770 [Alphaproteobacteria bacterium]|nr:MAG: hypothetical protein EON60_09770 [Alphaproteobacteria bacterium]
MRISMTAVTRIKRMRLKEFLAGVADTNLRASLLAVHRYYEDVWPVAPGSSHNHQAWPGGLRDHLADMCRRGWLMYQLDSLLYGELPFSFDDVVVCIFCHDAEKLVKNSPRADKRFGRYLTMADEGMAWEDVKWRVLAEWAFFGLVLTHAQTNALKYTHGEPESEYRKDKRVMNELAAFVHALDNTSARCYHDKGRGRG